MTYRLLSILALVAASCSQAAHESVAPSAPATSTVVAPAAPVAPDTEPRDNSVRSRDADNLLGFPTDIDRNPTTEDRLDYTGLPPSMVAALSATPTPRYRFRTIPGYPGLLEFAIFNTGSGWEERFLVQTPTTPQTGPRPLVVVFHKFGSSHGDMLNSGFIPEAINRGWYAICPLGARQKHFGNLESQINTRVAITLVRQLFPIDPLRVYGVGFSMGGGSAVNYAARHLDPKGTMFAAVCDHTGGVSLTHTWWSEYDDNDADDNSPNPGDNLEVPDILEDLFGGAPSTHAFDYQRCSTIDLDPFTALIDPDSDFARNLAHVPTLVWRATGDPTAFLVNQTDRFTTYMQSLNAGNQSQLAPGSVHAWTTLDANYVCNWFATRTLALPNSGRMLVDEDGQWLYFFVEQDAFGSFTPFTWSVDATLKQIEISASKNLKRLRITPAGFGLTLTGVVTLKLSTGDATGDEFQFLYVPAAPVSVTRDGVPMRGVWDPLAKTFKVVETDGGLHTWVLTFP
ncbi:MAG: hypothetical protein JNL28_05785 [Planctomycetes bacterium]|nr:hypothetical protein [Planctomycetota bacterium]